MSDTTSGKADSTPFAVIKGLRLRTWNCGCAEIFLPVDPNLPVDETSIQAIKVRSCNKKGDWGFWPVSHLHIVMAEFTLQLADGEFEALDYEASAWIHLDKEIEFKEMANPAQQITLSKLLEGRDQ